LRLRAYRTVTRKRRRTSKSTAPKKRKTKGKRRTSKKKKGESSEDEYREEEEGEEAEDDRGGEQDVTEMLTGDSYECPECTARGGQQVESRATLIVCPDSILTQWQQEIERHTRPGALKVPPGGGHYTHTHTHTETLLYTHTHTHSTWSTRACAERSQSTLTG
jgi:hypothetical protein